MPKINLEQEIKELNRRYHKLIFLCNRNEQFNALLPITNNFEHVNVNRVVSEGLVHINHDNYPFHVEEALLNALDDLEKVYYLQHIDILFDPSLKIHPIRMLESISKEYKLVVEWPGRYKESNLIYAEQGHPEHFICHDFEGRVIIK